MRVWRCLLQSWDGMAKMEYGWLKIRFGAQKYKKVIIALLCGFVLMALIYYGVRGMIPQMSVEEGSFSALLGALVGGFFSLTGSIGVAKMQQKSQREILKKNTIYKPLYDELMKNDDILRSKNPFPMDVWCDTNPRTIVESPSFAAWNRIQRDNRLLDVPESIQTQMNDLEETIERYLRLRRGVGTPVQKICYETLKAQGKENVLFTNIGDMVSGAVLNTDIDRVLEYIMINRITISAGASGLLLSFCSTVVSCIMPQKASFSKTFCHKLPDFT